MADDILAELRAIIGSIDAAKAKADAAERAVKTAASSLDGITFSYSSGYGRPTEIATRAVRDILADAKARAVEIAQEQAAEARAELALVIENQRAALCAAASKAAVMLPTILRSEA